MIVLCLYCLIITIVTECKQGYYKESSTPELCKQCPYNTTTDGTGSTRIRQCQLLPGNGLTYSSCHWRQSNCEPNENMIKRKTEMCSA